MGISKIIKIIEQEIVINNKMLVKQHSNDNKLEKIIEIFNNNDLALIQQEDIDVLKNNIELLPNEIEFLEAFSKIDVSYNSFFKTLGLDDLQKKVIQCIQEKIKKCITKQNEISEEEIIDKIKSLKILLSKLSNNDLNLITEIDELNELMNKYNVSLQERINIYIEINKINSKIFSNYNIEYKEQIIDESILNETNLSEEDLQSLFDELKSNIKLNKFPKDMQLRLLKYGNLDKIMVIIKTIMQNICIKHLLIENEVLAKILLYSNKEIIENVIKLAQNNEIENIIKEFPTIFFPAVRERKKINIGKGGDVATVETGSYNNFYKNIELLKELNIPISKAYEDCATFFIAYHVTTRRNVEKLQMYNISLLDQDSNYRKGLSVLKGSDILKNIDIAIELGLLEYIKQNISRISNFNNMYRCKLANKMYKQGQLKTKPQIYKILKNGQEKLLLTREFYSENSIFGDKPQDTFEKYKTAKLEISNYNIYDGIIGNNENDNISNLSTSDPIIKQLDNLYMTDEYVYNMDGIIVSRYKVLRIYETLISNHNIDVTPDLLLYVITMYSMLDDTELKNIKECINKITFSKQKELK